MVNSCSDHGWSGRGIAVSVVSAALLLDFPSSTMCRDNLGFEVNTCVLLFLSILLTCSLILDSTLLVTLILIPADPANSFVLLGCVTGSSFSWLTFSCWMPFT